MIFIDHFGCLMVLLINPSAATLDRRWAWKSRYVRGKLGKYHRTTIPGKLL